LTGNKDIKIGESIDPETSDISTYGFSQGGFNVVLVDTPGFDDNRPDMTDSKLLKNVTDFLVSKYVFGSSSIYMLLNLIISFLSWKI
jgi:predicted GTPase